MSSSLLLSVKEASVRYTDKPVFEDLSFNIHEGSRIALVGKNGTGKSTLMKIITGAKELDEGERWEEIGISIGYLKQDIAPKNNETVFDYISTHFKEDEKEANAYKIDMITEALQLEQSMQMTLLSGGQLRRAGLARVLVEEPDILLLDEPTNHLDLEIIEWLENYLQSYRGTLLCISHDRTFLANVTNKVFWLDRGQLKVSPKGFRHFDEWSTMLLEQEERELKNRKQMVAQEVEWASRGVKARRKRNVKRVELMKEMRDQLKQDEAAYRRATASIKIAPSKDLENNSKVVAEFYNVKKSFHDGEREIKIMDKFSFRVQRGDRIGILGKNGSGKTTFLKLLMKEIEPDQGRVKKRKELEFSYFDQKRSNLKPKDTLRRVLCSGDGDYINVMGKDRHVCGYLKDFMFDPSRANDRVSQLSGGQKNRLMLAKVLANPKSCLILDEPTNDLDMDTLDMLEEILSQYQGTLILVSHDRDFLDQTVTKILAFEGDGKIESHIGGYTDYLKHKKGKKPNPSVKKEKETKEEKTLPTKIENKQEKPKKLSYKIQRELDQLPEKIQLVEKNIEEFNTLLADTSFYEKDPEAFHSTIKQLDEAKAKLERYETRWLEIESMKE